MRLAIISDLHGDLDALRDALTQVERLGCDTILCAGDLVDGGLFPDEMIALLKERQIPCIRGNHDRWALSRGRAQPPHAQGGAVARDESGRLLSQETTRFLEALPTTWDATIDGVRVAVRHASPRGDMDGIYPDEVGPEDARRWLDQVQADVLLVGHTHIPFALELLGGGLIANPGALLRDLAGKSAVEACLYDPDSGAFIRAPRPGGGTFGILDLPSKRFAVHRASDGTEIEILRITPGIRNRRDR